MSDSPLLNFSYAYGRPESTAKFRQQNDDFIVRESLGFVPSGEGEHLLVHIKKEGENTSWVADKLANFFAVKSMYVSYCGKKDRNAKTSQWFSIYLPGQNGEVDWKRFVVESEINAEILHAARHSRKLRRGAHEANFFCIRLRTVSDLDKAIRRLEKIQQQGVPNYFGEQRFGREGSNLRFAARWFEHREKIVNRGKRSMVMSAARSYLFNRVLSARVDDGSWREALSGDPLSSEGLASGPLWGRGRLKSSDRTLALESSVLEDSALWCEQLEHLGLLQERRALQLTPIDLTWRCEGDNLIVDVGLPPGQYATALLREICLLESHT